MTIKKYLVKEIQVYQVLLNIKNKNFTMQLTIKEVVDALQNVEHPAISLSLIDLGILTDIELINQDVVVVFAFPFPNIPIADQLIQSVKDAVESLGLTLKFDIRTMTIEERERFLTLEASAWKG